MKKINHSASDKLHIWGMALSLLAIASFFVGLILISNELAYGVYLLAGILLFVPARFFKSHSVVVRASETYLAESGDKDFQLEVNEKEDEKANKKVNAFFTGPVPPAKKEKEDEK